MGQQRDLRYQSRVSYLSHRMLAFLGSAAVIMHMLHQGSCYRAKFGVEDLSTQGVEQKDIQKLNQAIAKAKNVIDRLKAQQISKRESIEEYEGKKNVSQKQLDALRKRSFTNLKLKQMRPQIFDSY